MNLRFVWVAFTMLLMLGCGATTGKFNDRYLPDSLPGQPVDRIAFDSSQNRIVADYLHSPNLRHDTALFWIHQDYVYLNLDGHDIIAIDPADKTSKSLGVEKKAAIYRMITDKVHIFNTVSEKDLLRQLLSSLFSSMGQHYAGKLTFPDSRQDLSVEIETKEVRADASEQAHICESAKLTGKFVDSRDKVTGFEWDYNCDWLPQSMADIKVPQLLRKVQISPSGTYIAYENILYNLERGGVEEKLIWDYPGTLSFSISPDWTKIAVLRGKNKKYWIEIYNLNIPRAGGVSAPSRQK